MQIECLWLLYFHVKLCEKRVPFRTKKVRLGRRAPAVVLPRRGRSRRSSGVCFVVCSSCRTGTRSLRISNALNIITRTHDAVHKNKTKQLQDASESYIYSRSYALKTPNPKVRSLSGHKCPEKCLSGHVNPRCRSYALKTMENLLKFLQVGWEVETIRLATIILYTMAFTFPQPRDSVRSFPSTLYGGSGGRKLPPRSWKR